jgi:hypothetical protein
MIPILQKQTQPISPISSLNPPSFPLSSQLQLQSPQLQLQSPQLQLQSPPSSTVQKTTKTEKKKLLNKNLLLVYYSSPIIISSTQILGLFISLSGIQYKFYDYLENTGQKEQAVIDNIINTCQPVCSQRYHYTPVFDEKAGSNIFNSLIINTFITGIFFLAVVFSFLLHIIIRTVIIQHYKERKDEDEKKGIKVSIKPILFVNLLILLILFILNIVFTSILIRIENFDRIKGGIFASITVGFFILVFLIAVSFAI